MSKQSKKLHKNIFISWILLFQWYLYFPIAIWMFYFLQYLDFREVAIIGAASTIAGSIFEIPTGAISDIIGRKKTLIISRLFGITSFVMMILGKTFWVFLVARFIQGISQALWSGSLESLQYDTLKESGQKDRFTDVVSRNGVLSWLALFVSSVVGGFLFDISPTLPYIVTTFFTAITLIITFFIEEPKIDSEVFSFSSYIKQTLKGFHELFSTQKRRSISLIMITITAGYFIASKILGISQAIEYGLEGKGVGMLFGAGYLIAAFSSHFYPQIRKKLSAGKLAVLASLVLIASFLGAYFVGIFFGMVLIFLRIVSSTTFLNSKSLIINEFIDSKNRATALSTMTLLSELPFVLLSYFIGDAIDKTSPNEFALILGIVMVGFLLPQLVRYRVIKKK
ncbi:MAG: MFS transporter [Candidatus Pacebacteria bacterium]|jgi:MFS family permease|nr:MFS transporter [Candidatus Paceibacterota bacterium]MBT4652717.1 MFS transporter [Candidatus Paceibacterota bacterium]MBT6755874.1 MFS transporter [Candidatus Paceibacterota bacterium]MBT6921087.1 MFS transporter [Candidatus Paceibacterota bacterium]